ncbi:MAG: TrmH family RNA methyltransferase [Minisyncoccia bacterium]|jgi:tRNA G18 (ribose-2'-O)-methylase SpoU
MKEIVVLLNDIRSLHNVGSILRTADAAGVSRIYLCGITPAPVDRFGKIRPQLAKVSLGAEKTVPWESVRASEEIKLIKELKRGGYKILSVEQSKKSVPYFKFKSTGKIALIMGNEVKGLPKNILKISDEILEIPMRGRKESLNVSVAFGIAIFGLLYK